jgi:hypothetical protein
MLSRTLLILTAVFTLQLSGVADPAPQPKPTVVEAFGYSATADGKTRSDLHRDALSDALQNAVLQAHTEFSIEACTEDMRLTKQTVTLRSRGYVESSRILEADFLPDNPSVYRIRIKALIRVYPTDQSSPSSEPASATPDSEACPNSSATELIQ